MLRRKTDDLQMACDGRFTDGHGQMCRLHLDAYDHLTATVAKLDALVAEAAAPFAAVIARLITIPGIGQRTAEVIVAETGGDMSRFATSARLAAWAVMARGQDYADAGEDYYDQRDQRNREHLIRHHQQALTRLRCQVTLAPPDDGSPPPRHSQPAPTYPAPRPGSLTRAHPTGRPITGSAARLAGTQVSLQAEGQGRRSMAVRVRG